MLRDLQLEFFVLSETKLSEAKLDESFSSAHFAIEIRVRRDRYGHEGGLIEFVKRGIICERVKQLETVISESICSEIAISRKKRFRMGICRPPNFNNLNTVFKEVSDSLSKVRLIY